MADQDINRNINITVTENATPTLEQVGRAWEELRGKIAQAEAQVESLSDEFDRRFRPMGRGAFQDMENGAKIATDQARKLAAQLQEAEQRAKALAEQGNAIASRAQAMAAESPLERNRVSSQFSTERSIYGHVRTNEEIASARAEHDAAIARAQAERQESEAIRGMGQAAAQANPQLQELKDTLEILQHYLKDTGPNELANSLKRIREVEEDIRRLGGTLNSSATMQENLSNDYPGMEGSKAEQAALRAESRFEANQQLRRQALAQEAMDLDRITTMRQVAAQQQATLDAERAQQAVFNRQKEVDAAVAAMEQETRVATAAAERQMQLDARRTQAAVQQYERLEQSYAQAQAKAQEAATRAQAAPTVGTQRQALTAATSEQGAAQRLAQQAERESQRVQEVWQRAYAELGAARQAYTERVRLDDALLEASAERGARARVESARMAFQQAGVAATEAAGRQVQADRLVTESAERTAQQRIRYYEMADIAQAQSAQRQQERDSRHTLGGQFGYAILNTALYTTAFGLIMQVQNAVTELGSAMFSKPAEEESAIVVYTRYLGDATEAQARYNEVMRESTKVGLPAKDLLELDQRLAQLGINSETSQERFGRSLQQVRKDLEDLSASPSLDPKQVMDFFTRAADGANRLLLSLKSAGVTTEQELRGLGVRLNQQGTQILSDSDTTTRALLTVIERHYGGLSDATGKTAEGMQTRWANTWDQIARTLGKDIFAEAENRQRKMLDGLSSDQTMSTVEKFGQMMGDSVMLIGMGWDLLSEKIGNTIKYMGQIANSDLGRQFLGATGIPMLGADTSGAQSAGLSFYEELHRRLDAIRGSEYSAADAAEKYGQAAMGAFSGAEKGAEDNRIAIANLKDELDGLRMKMADSKALQDQMTAPFKAQSEYLSELQRGTDKYYNSVINGMQGHLKAVQSAAKENQAAYEAQISPLQSHLQGLQRDADNLRKHYEGLIQPLKDQEEQLQRNYQAQKRELDLQRLNTKIGHAEALAQDIYSSQGRAAAESLPDLYNQRVDLRAQMRYEAQRQALEDKVKALERERDAGLAGIDADKQRTEDQIANIRAREKADQDAFGREEARWQSQIEAMEHQRDVAHEAYQGVIDGIDSQVKAIDKGFEREQKIIQQQITGTERTIDRLEKAMTAALETTGAMAEIVLGVVNKTVDATGRTIKEVYDQFVRDSEAGSPDHDSRPPAKTTPATGNRQPGVSPPAPTGVSPQSLRRDAPISNASAARGNQAQLTDRQSVKVEFVARDPNGKEWFRDNFETNLEWANRKIASSMKGA